MTHSSGPNRPPARQAEQLPLALSHPQPSGRDDLLVSASLTTALAIVEEWPRWPAPVVVLVGPPGCGKSHLAAIWRRLSAAKEIGEGQAQAARLAEEGAVLFEDADRRGFDDTAFFHLINSVRENGASLLITARQYPAAWPVRLADLRSRLKAVTVVEIGAPDEALLTQLVMKLFADRQLHMDDRLVGYIVTRMERSCEAARTLVERLDRLALARGAKITRAMAAEVLDDMSGGDTAIPPADDQPAGD